jgi:hypothetical protein
MRRLATIRRHVPLDLMDDYLLAWEALRAAVERVGARAWIFRGAEHEDHFLEFIEWKAGAAEPLGEADVTAALSQLDAFAVPGSSDEWEQAQ